MTSAELATKIEQAKPPSATRGWWSGCCQAHDDKVASLGWRDADKKIVVKCQAGCSRSAILAALALEEEDMWLEPKPAKNVKPLTIEALAKAKGFTVDFLKSLGVEQSDDYVKITHRLMDGAPASRHQMRHGGKQRFFWSGTKGESVTAYGLEHLDDAVKQGFLLLVEGPSDVWTALLHHVPALGVPGADMAKVLEAEHLKEIPKVYVLHEPTSKPGTGGDAFVAQIANRLQAIGYTGEAFEFQMPEALKDLNDLHQVKSPGHFHELLQAALDIAQPLAPPAKIEEPVLPPNKDYPLTAFGNRERLVDAFKDDILYATGLGWLEWDGKRWARDPEELRLQLRAEAIVKMICAEAEATPLKAMQRWAQTSQSRAAVNEMVGMAAAHVKADAEALDAHRMLFNVQDGTIELGSHHVREHRREDRLTHISPCTFDPHAEAPTWMKFLDGIMCGRSELVAYLQRLVGYCLTGEVSEQCFFIWHGSGANGKSTLLEVIRALMGHNYAKQTPAATFLQKKESGGGPSPEIARLKGCRLVTAVETDKGRRLSEALVKSATGGDRQVGRYLYQDLIEYDPTYKIIIAANHKPKVQGTDYAIWRRIQLLPFGATFKGTGDDRDMKKKLLAELPGILNWAITGAMLWAEHGLNPPDEVRVATETYRKEEDRLREFLEDRCVTVEGARARAGDLFKAYQEWCDEVGEQPVSQKEFGADLKERGFAQTRTKATRGWLGIGLVTGDAWVTRKAGTRETRKEQEEEAMPTEETFLDSEVPVSHVTSVTSVTPRKLDTSFNCYTVAQRRISQGDMLRLEDAMLAVPENDGKLPMTAPSLFARLDVTACKPGVAYNWKDLPKWQDGHPGRQRVAFVCTVPFTSIKPTILEFDGDNIRDVTHEYEMTDEQVRLVPAAGQVDRAPAGASVVEEVDPDGMFERWKARKGQG